HFQFTVKAHQAITHIKRLREAAEFTRSFLGSLQPLVEAGKLGCVLFQFPPFQNSDPELLKEFLAILPASVRCAFEFRHASWFAEEIYALLRNANAALCLAESEKLVVPEVETAGFVYFRLRKPEYSPAERKALKEKVGRLSEAKKDVYVYFKHEDTPEGASYAEELLARY
ncbi:MAG TPA: DUF72 domain-containing protein, partial [Terriglobales bacterium]|nr:DUF72 domain-containing protein [Terriglobales bacterium]